MVPGSEVVSETRATRRWPVAYIRVYSCIACIACVVCVEGRSVSSNTCYKKYSKQLVDIFRL